MRKTNIKDLS